MLCFMPSHSEAKQGCPKIELPSGVLGIFLTTTMLPVGTTMAMGRSSNTSGCGSGEPSDSFYRPSPARLELYLEETGDAVAEELAIQTSGPHLQALVHLAGCSPEATQPIGDSLREHYQEMFGPASTPKSAATYVSSLVQRAPLAPLCQDDQFASHPAS